MKATFQLVSVPYCAKQLKLGQLDTEDAAQ